MEDGGIRGINNYKGVMLCSRPNEIIRFLKEKPFCSRVDPKVDLGVNPVKHNNEWVPQPKKMVNEVLVRHKDWLEVFKLKMKLKKEMREDEQAQVKERFDKIKQMAGRDRERTKKMKGEFEKLNQSILMELNDNKTQKPIQAPLTTENLKKIENQEISIVKPQKQRNQKPKWACTEEEIKQQEEQEVNDLLKFVDTLDYDKYINDLEVNTMLKAIKNRVEELKKEDNWKEKAINRYDEKKKIQKEQDNLSQQSHQSQAKSVASERTQQSIHSLKSKLEDQKKGQGDWDSTTQDKNHKGSLEDRIAKLVADEVLRNYKNLSNIHSNQSIRRLLEKEARSHMINSNQDLPTKYDGPNISVVKDRTLRKDQLDPNNLPYMHRNPAI